MLDAEMVANGKKREIDEAKAVPFQCCVSAVLGFGLQEFDQTSDFEL